ncbi:hypothetical protein [Caproiciproducens sp.]
MFQSILTILLLFLLTFFHLRGLYWNIIDYQLNNSARKKMRKGQTFKEWFLYSRYRAEIPRILVCLYFVVIIVNVIFFLLDLLFFYLNYDDYMLFELMIIFDLGVMVILDIAFYGRKNGKVYYKIERWIKKRRKK